MCHAMYICRVMEENEWVGGWCTVGSMMRSPLMVCVVWCILFCAFTKRLRYDGVLTIVF